MITNDKQYKVAKNQASVFRESLSELGLGSLHSEESIHPKILDAHKNAVRYKLNVLLQEIKEYEDLKAGDIVIMPVKNLNDLPLALIKSRIANGLTQASLANMLGMKEQQVQRYESEGYESASLRKLLRIADVLKVHFSGDIQIKEAQGAAAETLRKYPFKQMFERSWFKNFYGSYNDAIKFSEDLINGLFEEAQLPEAHLTYNKQMIRSGSAINEYALKAWYARIVIKAREQEIQKIFSKDLVDTTWIKDLTSLSTEENGPIKAVNYLKDNGINVVIEPHLEGTHLDGASMLLDGFEPIIALTLRHDRLDNFWFVLFHELAHVVLHLGVDYNAIFDDLDITKDGIELEADSFALNALIPDAIWKHSLIRYSPSEKAIINQALTLNIHPALVAGRIRRETGRYHEFSNLIGQGEVRSQFFK